MQVGTPTPVHGGPDRMEMGRKGEALSLLQLGHPSPALGRGHSWTLGSQVQAGA